MNSQYNIVQLIAIIIINYVRRCKTCCSVASCSLPYQYDETQFWRGKRFGGKNVLAGHTEAAALQAEAFVAGPPFKRSHEQGGAYNSRRPAGPLKGN